MVNKFIKLGSNRLLILSLILISVSLPNYAQTEQTYWRINAIYKEDGQGFRGATSSQMHSLFEQQMHFRKIGNLLNFDFPTAGVVIAIDTLKSLSNERFDKDFFVEEYRGQLTDSVYFVGLEEGFLKIKFINSYTGDKDKRTVISFRELSADEYDKSLATADSIVKAENTLMALYVDSIKQRMEWSYPKVETRTQLVEILNKELEVLLPSQYLVEGTGAWYTQTFDRLKIGSMSDTSEFYQIGLIDGENEFDDPYIIFSTEDKDKFDFNRYIRKFDSRNIIYNKDNSLVYLETSYDRDDQTISCWATFFKYIYANGIHIIFNNEIKVNKEDLSRLESRFQLMKELNIKII